MTLKHFNDDQASELEIMVDKAVETVTARKAADDDEAMFEETSPLAKKDRDRLNTFSRVWRNNGMLKDGRKVSLQEMLNADLKATTEIRGKDNFSSDHPLLTQRVIVNIAKDAIEPNLMLTPLLQRMTGMKGIQVVFPSWGAMVAGKVGEGEEYPEMSLELAGQITATVGKYGVAVKMTDEMIENSQFDVMGAHIRAAGRAMARLKEENAKDLILNNGRTLLDNSTASARKTTGRNAAGAYNGTLTLDDLFYCYGQMINTGFTPNTLIMHPFAWQIFAQDGIARAFGFTNGVNPLMWQAAQGQAGKGPNSWNQGLIGGNNYVSQPQQLATTFTNVPSIFPTNFQIVITPYMPFTAASGSTLARTDVVLCDRAELGVIVENEALTTEEWRDPARDIRKIKFREKYGMASSNDGRGIGLLKNIAIGKSFDFADQILLTLTGLTDPLSGDTLTGATR